MRARILIRTHYFDDTITRLYEKWSRILPNRVGILMDETRGPIDVAGLPKISFDLAKLATIGLPALPPERTAWHCGDYVMAAVGPLMQDDEFAIVIENDAVPGIASVSNWRAVIDTLSQSDLAVSRFAFRGRKWKWQRNVQNIYGPDRQFAAMIVVQGFTKSTANHMTSRRSEIAEARRQENFDDWPNGELFVGAEAKRAGMKVADLENFIPAVKETVSTHVPYWFDDIISDDSIDTVYHPATNSRDKYIAKVGVMIAKGFSPAVVEAKVERLGKLSDAEYRRIELFRQRMKNSRTAATR